MWALDRVLPIFHTMGIRMAANKTEGQSTQLVFLGILINTHTYELHLPAYWWAQFQILLQSLLGK